MPTIGERIKEIREDRRLTQDQLAERSGVSKGFLSDIENNKRNPSSESVLKIANALGASIDYLLRGEERHSPIAKEPIVIPPELSEAAEENNWSYAQTIELLDAYRSIVARRSNRQVRPLAVKDWIELQKAISSAFR